MKGGCQDIYPLGRTFHPNDLASQQAAAASFGQYLYGYFPCAGKVSRFGATLDYGADPLDTQIPELPFLEAGTCDFHFTYFGDGCSHHPGERGVATPQVDARYPSMAVGDCAEGDVEGSAAHQMERLGAIACCPDTGYFGFH